MSLHSQSMQSLQQPQMACWQVAMPMMPAPSCHHMAYAYQVAPPAWDAEYLNAMSILSQLTSLTSVTNNAPPVEQQLLQIISKQQELVDAFHVLSPSGRALMQSSSAFLNAHDSYQRRVSWMLSQIVMDKESNNVPLCTLPLVHNVTLRDDDNVARKMRRINVGMRCMGRKRKRSRSSTHVEINGQRERAIEALTLLRTAGQP